MSTYKMILFTTRIDQTFKFKHCNRLNFDILPGSLGGSTVEACQLCPPGYYCNRSAMAEPSGQCAEGYYCPEGQSSERPQQHVCSVGHCCEKVKLPYCQTSLLSIVCDCPLMLFYFFLECLSPLLVLCLSM